MGAASESVAVEKDAPSRTRQAPNSDLSAAPTSGTSTHSRIVSAATESPTAAAQLISQTGANPAVLQRAQRSFGNRASQQIVMRARAIQRKCDCGGTCEKCQEEEGQRVLQRSAADQASPVFNGIPSSQGEPLNAETLHPLETHFQSDLSDVRVHTNTEAAESATALDAHAYTTGRDIYFAPGMYAPTSASGKRLLTHEVAHVVQQSSGKEPTVAMKSAHGIKIGSPDDMLEAEADQSADAFLQANMPQTDEGRRRLSLSPPRPSSVVQRSSVLSETGRGNYILRQETSTALAPGAPPIPTPDTVAAITDAVNDDDVSAAVVLLRNRPIEQLAALRLDVFFRTRRLLERWFIGKLNQSSQQHSFEKIAAVVSPTALLISQGTSLLQGNQPKVNAAAAEEGLRWLWPALPLIDRLEIYDEGYREIEQAQLDTIRHASTREREKAKESAQRLEAVYSSMDAKEEYQARTLIDPSPNGLLEAATKLLGHASTPLWGSKDIFYDAVLALHPVNRQKFFEDHNDTLKHVLWDNQFALIKILSQGSEAEGLIARLKLATKNRSDDMAAVQAIVDRAVELLGEKRTLLAQKADPHVSDHDRETIESRLRELGELEKLLQFNRDKAGKLDSDSFLGLLSSAHDDPDAFGTDATRLAAFSQDPQKFAFEFNKQRILLAKGDVDALTHTFLSIHAPRVQPATPGAATISASVSQYSADVELRKALVADADVHNVLTSLKGSEQMHVLNALPGDDFNEALDQLNQFRLSARWGEFFDLVLTIARKDDWRERFEATGTHALSVYAGTFGEQREIMLTILRERRMPLAAVLKYTGNVGILQAALGNIGEADRAQLREGWALARQQFIGPLTPEQQETLRVFQEFEANLRKSQGSDAAGFEDVLGTVLGSTPTAKELVSPEGRYNAAALMYERIEARLALDRGLAAEFTETDETMVAAGREFVALWLRLRDKHALSFLDFTALSALNETFLGRAKEFSEASKAITDLAGTIAATIAGIVVVVATGGTATPAVIALAAGAGAGAGLVTREMFGGDYYSATSSAGAQAALLDALNGALAVVSGGLAAKGAELVGLGGKALTTGAARVAGSVAEEATNTLGRRVAASAVEAAIDGFFSGAVSEGFAVMLDDRTWRKGILAGLLRAGEAAIAAGLTGMATGGVLGAATPLAGAAFGKVYRAAFGEALDRTLARAGASDLLAAARVAAKRGDVTEVNRLAEQMEAHLSPDEANILRQELRSQLQEARGRPPGTAETTKEEQDLLRASGSRDGTPLPQELDAEKAVIARSEPQVSTEAGYVDEVDLGNGHVWRRTEEGTWCRFSKKDLCGTVIENAVPISPLARARARRAEVAGDRLLVRGTDDPVGRAADIRRLKNTPPTRPAHLGADQEQMWRKYTDYYSKRLEALEKGVEAEPPRTFESYSNFQSALGRARQGIGFQEEEAAELIRRLDAETNVGLSKVKTPRRLQGESETKFVDVLLSHPEQGRVGISFKARAFDDPAKLAQQVTDDVEELVQKYGGERYIRRRGPEFGQKVQIDNLVLSYEALRIRTIRGGTPEQMHMFIEMVVGDAAEKYPGLRIAVVFR